MINTSNQLKKTTFIQSLCIISAISFFIFFQFNINFNAYIGVAFSLLILFLLCFNPRKNDYFYLGYLSCIIINLGIFLFQKYLDGFRIFFDFQDISYILYIVVVFLISIYSIVHIFRNKVTQDHSIKNYFSERKYDLKRLKIYLNRFSAVGLNSFWGEGKTYLFNLLRQDSPDAYNYISVCVMTVKTDIIENYILNEINAILEQNKIISFAASKLASILKRDNFYGMGDFLVKNNSYTYLLSCVANDIEKLDKPILITFEDIDRINNKELIYRVFALSERLSSQTKKVKILFQYDESRLLEILEEKRFYLEKYVPYTISLTPINFKRCIKIFLSEGKKVDKYSLLKLDDFNFLFFQTNLNYDLQKIFEVNKSFSVDVFSSIRKIELFLNEIQEYLQQNSAFVCNIRQVITFFYIKHFKDLDYLDLGEESYSTCNLFSYEDKEYSIYELVKIFKESKKDKLELFDTIFKNNSKNLSHLINLHFFGYRFTQLENCYNR